MTALTSRPPPRDVEVDWAGEASFPASDPPAVWTWEVEPAPVHEADAAA